MFVLQLFGQHHIWTVSHWDHKLYEAPYLHWQIVSAEVEETEVGMAQITPYINV